MSTAMNPAPGLQVAARVAHGSAFTMEVDLALPGRGVTALFGPSGCGKTTLLRAVAGLVRPAPGRIVINGEVWQDDANRLWRPTHQRPLGFVFQEASLFPHLTVRGNLDFGLKRVPAAQRRVPLEHAIELLGIGALLDRPATLLSGGERQRVGIARALATSPRLLLLDEPLASLDASRRAEVLPYFERLQRELDMPMLYVTHAMDEVAHLADHMVLMQAGRAVASGPAAELMTRLDLSLAQGEAGSAVLQGVVEGFDTAYQLLQVRFAGGLLHCAAPGAAPPRRAPGQSVRLRIAARDVSLARTAPQDSSILNLLPATVMQIDARPEDAHATVALDAGGARLLARITRKSADALSLAPGQPVFAQIKGVAVLD
ncbi:MAG: molybdenum ABC transporter ATP-binding protein [Comamonadaceae bacterium]|nr:molybdenum ABC transporter ATP-binding protein [Comamonadaceae bacterium]